MNQKEYQIIAGAIHRTKMIAEMDKNSIRRDAKLAAIRLLATDMTASLKHEYSNFNESMFTDACGITYKITESK